MVAIEAVGHHAREQAQQQGGQLPGKRHQAEHEGGLGQLVDQPALSHPLHPEAGSGDELTDKEQAEVAVLERAQTVGQLPAEGAGRCRRCRFGFLELCVGERCRLGYHGLNLCAETWAVNEKGLCLARWPLGQSLV